MRRKYRSRTDIIADLLEIIKKEKKAGITKLMYTSFLSYRQVRAHLSILIKEGLVEYDKLDRFYSITAEGRQALGIYNEMNEMLNG